MMRPAACDRLDLRQSKSDAQPVYLVASWATEVKPWKRWQKRASIGRRIRPAPAAVARPGQRAASISIAIAGSGGSGVMTAGTLLLDAAAKAGLYGLMVRTSGPQIRGGEAAALLRLARRPVDALDDGFDRPARDRLAEREPVRRRDPASRVERDDRRPRRRRGARRVFRSTGARYVPLSFKKMAKAHPGELVQHGRARARGHRWPSIPPAALESAVRDSWKRSDDALSANLAALRAGIEAARTIEGMSGARSAWRACEAKRWLISGNEAAGYGALRGGVRFVAAYPITPATELLEWMAPALTKVGGTLLQAEDELASINMIIGASYGGVPSLTATAGPGLALMTEGIGLAVSAKCRSSSST